MYAHIHTIKSQCSVFHMKSGDVPMHCKRLDCAYTDRISTVSMLDDALACTSGRVENE